MSIDSTDSQASGAALYGQMLDLLTQGSRTQLGRIQETTEELLHAADPAQKPALERIRQSVWELASIIADVSDLYAIGRRAETDSSFDLRVTLEGLRARLSRSLPQAEWMVLSRIRHEVPPLLEGKPASLQSILLGATAALVQIWPEGTLRIDVSKGWERERAIELVFRCEARPAAPPTAEQVEGFRSMFSADRGPQVLTLRDLRPQLARRLASAGGGSLGLAAEQDGALAIELRLPFTLRQVSESVCESPAPPKLRGRRALICDGSEERRERLAATLRLWGLTTHGCGRSAGVLEALREAAAQGRPFDFALVDAELEDLDGLAMARLIREDPASGAIHLAMLFGVGLRGDAGLAEQAGFAAYLPRTISVRELREALAILMKRTGAAARSGAIVTQHTLADVRLEGVRILIVSHDPVGALVLGAVLRRKGFGVDRVDHVAEAAERCEKTPYDFLVLDLTPMSEQDRAQAAGLRALTDARDPTPIAVLVERADSEEARGLEDLSPEAIFAKPVDLERICAFCEGFLYPELAPPPVRPAQEPIVFVVSNIPEVSGSAVFERERLDEATMGIESLQLSVVESFLDEMPRRVDAISAAVTGEDVTAAEREVLSARALALTIGAFATARCLDELGTQILERRFEEAQAMVERLRGECEKSLVVLRAAHATMGTEGRAA